MSTPRKNIPTEGQHKGDESKHVSGFNVRAPGPLEAERYRGRPAESLFQLQHNEAEERYRVRSWTEGEVGKLEDGYEETGQYTTQDELTEAIDELPGSYYIVLENTERSTVHFDRESDLSGNWADQGRFDQMTLFQHEDEAARYADRRRTEFGAGASDDEETAA